MKNCVVKLVAENCCLHKTSIEKICITYLILTFFGNTDRLLHHTNLVKYDLSPTCHLSGRNKFWIISRGKYVHGC